MGGSLIVAIRSHPSENRYSSKQFVRARISRAKFRQLLRLFALDLTAVQITALTALNRNTVNRYLRLTRQAIAQHCERESPFSGDVELDESYFGARPVRGKRGRGARGKTIVFGVINVMAGSTRKLSRTAKKPIFRPLFGAKWS